jgi:hypothetical protein
LRVRTDFWVGALCRRVQAAGAFVAIARKGADEAGAVFIAVDRRNGLNELYGPAPQSLFEEGAQADRMFIRYLEGATADKVAERMASEIRFDPDLWLIDIEDNKGRPFVDIRRTEG